MTETLTIPRAASSFPEYLDFESLRAAGIKHCQGLSAGLWTDFNLHDPGITILEALCYALTDLGYRTNLPIEDLIARSGEQKTADQKLAGPDGKPLDDNFFTAEQILTCNPVTILDLRKLLINVAGVRNAWLRRADESETPVYLDEANTRLSYDAPAPVEEAGPRRIRIDGLYEVLLELESATEEDDFGEKSLSDREDQVRKDVLAVLHQHRNLCEDFLDVQVLGEEEIAICVELELDSNAVPEDVLAAVHQDLESFLSPEINFYSLQEMLQRGKGIEEIYAGRPLFPITSHREGLECSKSKGFIDEAELLQTEPREELHASDLYRLIMSVDGVLAARNLMMVNRIEGEHKTRGEKWTLQLTPGRRPKFDLERSRIVFFKEQLRLPVDAEMRSFSQDRFDEAKRARAKAPLEPYQLDRAVPEGKHRSDLQDYRTVIHEFPLVYGIGEGGVPDSAPERRRVQAKQLRAYLLFYDQILANYLGQLANLRELFSMRSDESAHRIQGGKNRTYFTQRLSHEDVPDIRELIRNYNACGYHDSDGTPKDYEDYLKFITESEETYLERRNRFLDHLLARFAESFTDYVMLMFDVNGRVHDGRRIIEDKTAFLSTYPETSRNRGKAFDYSDPNVWNTNNVSGLEHRVSRLMGLRREDQCSERETFLRRTLGRARVVEVGGWRWKLEVPGDSGDPPLQLQSSGTFSTQNEAEQSLVQFRVLAADAVNYRRMEHFNGSSFAVVDASQHVVLETEQRWATSHERDLWMNRLVRMAIGGRVKHQLSARSDRAYYKLADAVGERSLFDSVEGFATTAEAEFQFTSRFLPAASTLSNYVDIDEDDYTFGLASDDGALLARHLHRYETKSERDDRKRAVFYAIAQPDVQHRVDEEESGFFYSLVDTENRRLVRASGPAADEAEAEAAFERFRTFAIELGRYRRIDGPCAFGFEVHDDAGPIAESFINYPSAGERDATIHLILAYLIDEQPARQTYAEGAYRFELAVGEERLLIGAGTHASPDWARDAGERAWASARRPERIRIVESKSSPCPHTLELLGPDDVVIARGAKTFRTVENAERARQRLYGLAQDGSHIDGFVRSLLRFHVADADGQRLLSSAVNYWNEASASAVFETAAALARDEKNYRRTERDGRHGYQLAVQDEVIAQNSVDYATERQRDAAISRLSFIAMLRGARYSVFEKQRKQFGFRLLGRGDSVCLQSIEFEVSAACAGAMVLRLLQRAHEFRAFEDQGEFGFRLLDKSGEVLAEHPKRYASAAARDEALSECETHLSSRKLEPIFSEEGFFYEVSTADGQALLRSVERWDSERKAEEAYRNVFLPLAVEDANYERTYDNTNCAHSFLISDETGKPIAEHPLEHKRAETRDEQIRLTLELLRRQEITTNVHGAENGFYFQLGGEDSQLESVARHVDAGEASLACNSLLRVLAAPETLKIIPAGDDFVLEASDGQAAARSQPQTLAAIEALRDSIIELASDNKPFPGEAVPAAPALRSQLENDAGEAVLEGWQDLTLPLLVKVDGFSTTDERENALQATWQFLKNSTDPPPSIHESDGAFYYRFEVNADLTIESWPGFAEEALARNAAKQLTGLVFESDELFRRRDDSAASNYGFDILDRPLAKLEALAWDGCDEILDVAQSPSNFHPTTSSDGCTAGFEVVDEGRPVARSRRFWNCEEQRDEATAEIRWLSNAEGLHLVEHTLLRPMSSGADSDEERREMLFPLGDGCRGTDGALCPGASDLYTFRATIVAPYWPDRFRKVEFRRFFARTMRLETPAHVFLRICWIDAEQMRTFERAYRRWLETRSRDVPEAERVAAQRAMLEILVSLRNVYPTAKLAGCESGSGEESVVLGQTILGTGAQNDND